jgi:hypothetical protein
MIIPGIIKRPFGRFMNDYFYLWVFRFPRLRLNHQPNALFHISPRWGMD